VLRAGRLNLQLQASEAALREGAERMALAADAARLGMWIWDVPADDVWLSDKSREILAFPPGTVVTYDLFMGRLHPDEQLWVYGRTGKPCFRCGVAIEMRRAGPDARATWWCPRCQPPRSSRPEGATVEPDALPRS